MPGSKTEGDQNRSAFYNANFLMTGRIVLLPRTWHLRKQHSLRRVNAQDGMAELALCISDMGAGSTPISLASAEAE